MRHHDDNISVREARVRRYMEGVSFEEFQNLMLLQMADARAHVLHPMVVERIAICSMMAGKEGERIYRSCSEEKTDKTETHRFRECPGKIWRYNKRRKAKRNRSC